MTTPDITYCVWKRLRDGWGVEVVHGSGIPVGMFAPDVTGQTVTVSSRDGKRQQVTLGRQLWRNESTPWNPAKAVYRTAKEKTA